MKKRNIIILIVLMVIGFAAVSATLYINGTTNIGANTEDFKVYFSKATLDSQDVSNDVIKYNGKNIEFETKKLTTIGENTTLEYIVTNASMNYDAEVTMTCNTTGNASEYVSIENSMINKPIAARTTEKGSIKITLETSVVEEYSLSLSCNLVVDATEREELAEGDIVEIEPNTYSFYGYFVDAEEQPVRNANLVMYSEEPKYITTDTRGYFYISGLEKGEHELYYLKDKTIDELKALSKDKIKEDATANVTLTTEDNESDEVEFDEEYKITSSIIEKTTNRTYLITLDANGGEPETQTYQVTQNRQYGVLPTPTREEYIFLGWFLENQKIEGDYLVTESGEHTLIAQWTDNKDFPFDNINYKNFSNAMSSSGADNFQIVSSFDYKIIVVSMINGGGNTYSININGVDKTNEMMARDGHVGALVYKGKKDDVINVTRTSGYGNVNITLIG